MIWNRIKIFKSLCETCKKHCGGHFDIATVYQCDDWIKKEEGMKDIYISKNFLIKGMRNDLRQCKKSEHPEYRRWVTCIQDYIRRLRDNEYDLVKINQPPK